MWDKETVTAYNRKYYLANKEALSAHQHDFYVANKEAILVLRHEYYQANKKSIIAQKREYLRINKEAKLTYMREYYQANRGACLARNHEYHVMHPDDCLAAWHRYRARQRNVHDGTVTAATIVDKRLEYGGICPYCNGRIKKGHLDHIVPLTNGGMHSLDNLVWACAECNMRKTNTSLLKFMLRRTYGH